MKIDICENLLRRSMDNHILTRRHNRREDEMLEKKFAIYQRHIRFIDDSIHMAEHRFEQHIKDKLGFVITYRHKPLEASQNHTFYYASTNKNWTTKIYSVKPLHSILQHKNLYQDAFERRSQQYLEELKQKNRSQKIRKEHLMNKTISLIRDDYKINNNDWPLSDNARIKLPLIHHSKSNPLRKVHFPIEI